MDTNAAIDALRDLIHDNPPGDDTSAWIREALAEAWDAGFTAAGNRDESINPYR